MKGKIVLVTGATDGIGRQTALDLAKLGATVIVHGRTRAKAEAAVAELKKVHKKAVLHAAHADLASIAEIRALAADVRARFPELHVLLHNAGVFMQERVLTPEGWETTFMVNHLAPVLLTFELLPALQAAGGARVVTVSSMAHNRAPLDFDNLEAQRGFDGYATYAVSKLANVLFTQGLANRYPPEVIAAFSLHPGVIDTAAQRLRRAARRGPGERGADLGVRGDQPRAGGDHRPLPPGRAGGGVVAGLARSEGARADVGGEHAAAGDRLGLRSEVYLLVVPPIERPLAFAVWRNDRIRVTAPPEMRARSWVLVSITMMTAACSDQPEPCRTIAPYQREYTACPVDDAGVSPDADSGVDDPIVTPPMDGGTIEPGAPDATTPSLDATTVDAEFADAVAADADAGVVAQADATPAADAAAADAAPSADASPVDASDAGSPADASDAAVPSLDGGLLSACQGGGNVLFLSGDNNPDAGLRDPVHPYDEVVSGPRTSMRTQVVDSNQTVRFSVENTNNRTYDIDFSTRRSMASLAPGAYPMAMRYPFEGATNPGLSVIGGCNTLTGSFEVVSRRLVDGLLADFSATFVQHCEGGPARLSGCIQYANTNMPDGTVPPSISPALFDPDQTYMVGTVAGGLGVAHWSTPDTESVGLAPNYAFSDARVARGSILYTMVHANGRRYVQQYRPDAYRPPLMAGGAPEYPRLPWLDDPFVPTPGCTNQVPRQEPQRLFVRPDGSIVYTCTGDSRFYDETGAVLGSGNVFDGLALGPGDSILTRRMVQTGTTARSFTGFPSGGTQPLRFARRWQNGFRALYQGGGTDQLWNVAVNGAAVLEGTYPADPAGLTPLLPVALDGNGDLFSLATQGAATVVVRKSISGTSAIVYTSASGARVALNMQSILLTGP